MQGIRVTIPVECMDRLIGLLESDRDGGSGDATDEEIAALEQLIERLNKAFRERQRSRK